MNRGNRCWHWEKVVTSRPDEVVLQGADGFFSQRPNVLNNQTLFLFDWHRGRGESQLSQWGLEEYSGAIHRTMTWMTEIPRWNAISCYPPTLYHTKSYHYWQS